MLNRGKKKFGLVCLTVVSLCLLIVVLKAYFLPSKKPNIILVSIDTLRADHLACYGYDKKTSPNIDIFAKDSVLFQNAVSQAPMTTPAHMSIFTSLTPAVHRVRFFKTPEKMYSVLDERIKTLPQILEKNGYLTVGLTGLGLVEGIFGFDRGFDAYKLWWNIGRRPDVRQIPQAIDAVRKAIRESSAEGKPLFLFLHHYICHDPYLKAPEEFKQKFLYKKIEGLPLYWEDIEESDDFSVVKDSFWKNIDLSDSDARQYVISLYDSGVYYSDYVFGELMKLLKEERYYDDSIIILVSDHGEEFYEHLDKAHWRLFIETLRVPLIIKFPGNKYGGRIIHEFVRTLDIMPMLFDFMRIKARNFMQGVSFLPLVIQKSGYKPLIVSYSNQGKPEEPIFLRFIDDGFIYSNQPSNGTEEWLFDAYNDPAETINLAARKPDVLNRMRAISMAVLAKDGSVRTKLGCRDNVIINKDKGSLNQLKSLGYLQ